MITTPFTRPVNICIMILVIALHGLTAWAVVSMNIPQRPKTERFESKPIQVELVTLATSSEEESPAEEIPTKEILAKNTVDMNDFLCDALVVNTVDALSIKVYKP